MSNNGLAKKKWGQEERILFTGDILKNKSLRINVTKEVKDFSGENKTLKRTLRMEGFSTLTDWQNCSSNGYIMEGYTH